MSASASDWKKEIAKLEKRSIALKSSLAATKDMGTQKATLEYKLGTLNKKKPIFALFRAKKPTMPEFSTLAEVERYFKSESAKLRARIKLEEQRVIGASSVETTRRITPSVKLSAKAGLASLLSWLGVAPAAPEISADTEIAAEAGLKLESSKKKDSNIINANASYAAEEKFSAEKTRLEIAKLEAQVAVLSEQTRRATAAQQKELSDIGQRLTEMSLYVVHSMSEADDWFKDAFRRSPDYIRSKDDNEPSVVASFDRIKNRILAIAFKCDLVVYDEDQARITQSDFKRFGEIEFTNNIDSILNSCKATTILYDVVSNSLTKYYTSLHDTNEAIRKTHDKIIAEISRNSRFANYYTLGEGASKPKRPPIFADTGPSPYGKINDIEHCGENVRTCLPEWYTTFLSTRYNLLGGLDDILLNPDSHVSSRAVQQLSVNVRSLAAGANIFQGLSEINRLTGFPCNHEKAGFLDEAINRLALNTNKMLPFDYVNVDISWNSTEFDSTDQASAMLTYLNGLNEKCELILERNPLFRLK